MISSYKTRLSLVLAAFLGAGCASIGGRSSQPALPTIHQAIMQGDLALFSTVVDAQANLAATNSWGSTIMPLDRLLTNESQREVPPEVRLRMMIGLVQADAQWSHFQLQQLARNSHPSMIDEALQRGLRVDQSVGSDTQACPLIFWTLRSAISAGPQRRDEVMDSLRFLLARGADMNAKCTGKPPSQTEMDRAGGNYYIDRLVNHSFYTQVMMYLRYGNEREQTVVKGLIPYMMKSASFDEQKMENSFNSAASIKRTHDMWRGQHVAKQERRRTQRAANEAFEREREAEAYRAFAQEYSRFIVEGNKRVDQINNRASGTRRSSGSSQASSGLILEDGELETRDWDDANQQVDSYRPPWLDSDNSSSDDGYVSPKGGCDNPEPGVSCAVRN